MCTYLTGNRTISTIFAHVVLCNPCQPEEQDLAILCLLSAMEEIKRILAADDHFSVLDLPVAPCSQQQVRLSYRRLAIQVHPDKIQAADKQLANQAFVLLSQAYEILSDVDEQSKVIKALQKGEKSIVGRQARETAFPYQPKWWERPWSEIEQEIARQEAVFKQEKAKWMQRKEKNVEKRAEKRRKRAQEVQEGLAWLKEQYGLDEEGVQPAQNSSEHITTKTILAIGQKQEEAGVATYSSSKWKPPRKRYPVRLPPTRQEQPSTRCTAVMKGPSSAKQNEHICFLCQRRFETDVNLAKHCQLSTLHQQNLKNLEDKQELRETSPCASPAHCSKQGYQERRKFQERPQHKVESAQNPTYKRKGMGCLRSDAEDLDSFDLQVIDDDSDIMDNDLRAGKPSLLSNGSTAGKGPDAPPAFSEDSARENAAGKGPDTENHEREQGTRHKKGRGMYSAMPPPPTES
eukprot:g2619.t1